MTYLTHHHDGVRRAAVPMIALALWVASVILTVASLGCSCAHSPEQAKHYLHTSNQISNVVATVDSVGAQAPAPVGPLVAGLCAIATGLLGVWNAGLQRTVLAGKGRAAAAKREDPASG